MTGTDIARAAFDDAMSVTMADGLIQVQRLIRRLNCDGQPRFEQRSPDYMRVGTVIYRLHGFARDLSADVRERAVKLIDHHAAWARAHQEWTWRCGRACTSPLERPIGGDYGPDRTLLNDAWRQLVHFGGP